MKTTIFAVDPSWGYLTFALYLFPALVFGTAAYLMMRRPHLLRPECRALISGPSSRRCALTACLTVALPFLIYGYIESWQHFFSVDSAADKLIITYLCPKRTREITDIAALQVNIETEVRKGAQYRITLKDHNGHEFTSQLMSQPDVKRNVAALRAEIKKYRDQRGSP